MMKNSNQWALTDKFPDGAPVLDGASISQSGETAAEEQKKRRK